MKGQFWAAFGLALGTLLLAACAGGGSEATPTPDPLVEEGRLVFTQHCASCHALTEDTVLVGPPLAHIATEAANRVPGMSAREYIEASILQPDAYIVEGFGNLMPSDMAKRLSGTEFEAVVAFLMTLR